MSILDPRQLTGRTRTHVLELAEPRCTLHAQAMQAFLELRLAASQAGIDLEPAATFRDFDRQLAIWNAKFHGQRPLLDRDGRALDAARLSEEERVRAILLWSALPGASRHHWGTEIDVIDGRALDGQARAQLLPSEYAPGGVFAKLGEWLSQHCESHGFFRPYDRDRGGVQPEPWHLSYAPISSEALPALRLEILADALRDVDLAGGQVVHRWLADIHRRYVLAVATPSAMALVQKRLSPAARSS